MIVHVVLFRPKADLSPADEDALERTFTAAIAEISSIRRVRVGRRITHGRGYETLMRTNYSHIALLEFDRPADLKAYLEHPAHEALATRFFAAFEEALMYDFALVDGSALATAGAFLRGDPPSLSDS